NNEYDLVSLLNINSRAFQFTFGILGNQQLSRICLNGHSS
ncbi:unnamed protein product, partial [Brassica oleracea var. botrytis]